MLVWPSADNTAEEGEEVRMFKFSVLFGRVVYIRACLFSHRGVNVEPPRHVRNLPDSMETFAIAKFSTRPISFKDGRHSQG
jgi:hypothetical protein